MSPETQHILGNYQKALDDLNADIRLMAQLVEKSLETAKRGLLERDSAACGDVIADDEEIDQLEKSIDEDGLKIITLYQPVATDLRSIVATMKVSSNLERVGDQAVGIAKRARKMNKNPEIPEIHDIESLFEIAIRLLRMSLQALHEGDVEIAMEVKDRDNDLDKAYKALGKQLTTRMVEDPERIKDYLDLQFMARFLERVGDHAKNISDEAVFVASAVDIRHGGALPEQQNQGASSESQAASRLD